MQIVFTNPARKALKDICDYYKSTGNAAYSKKLRENIFQKVKLLLKHPDRGMKEPYLAILEKEHRYLLEDRFKIIYRVIGQVIYITDVFDTKQDPEKLIERNRKI